MIRIYRQPRYGYWVLAVDRASFRIGRGRSDHWIGLDFVSPRDRWWRHQRGWLIALWFFGLFLQIDWDLNDGGLR